MSIHTKYVGERSNIVLQSCTFGLSPTYVDNHRYALVKGEPTKRRLAVSHQILCSAESQSALSFLCKLRPLKTKRGEVAYHVLSIFLTFGAPTLLQSNNGREFSNQVIPQICAMWKDFEIVRGNPRHSQTQGSVERANQDKQNMLTAWMNDTDTNKLSEGLPLVQFAKSTSYLEGIRQRPYETINKNVTNLTKKFSPAQIGDDVKIQVPDVDHGRTDNRNVLAVVVGIEDSDYYKLANENSTLKKLYRRNQFVICKEKLLSIDEINFQEMSLREAAAANSRSGGQDPAKSPNPDFARGPYYSPLRPQLRYIEVKVGITFQDGDRFNSCQVVFSQFGLAIHQNDHQARRRFVEWAQNEIAVVPDFHKRILFSDEAHFWLNGYVNKQNCRIWSKANPQVYVETPLQPEKLTVWCALWAGGILLQKR
ncbi:KRAB-A domain-containing protein 2 [Trichonephila clavipes]|uniref:KRAB-A domain-containing protein 2 n=1 Tax=Trichonephila clavipes TaxID=2585209 RepID=A0A8X6W011_TRICX|nr:KRAB-A domain-containing protein 2 [Trichonephila clavipes]